jgi:hypothetical protein
MVSVESAVKFVNQSYSNYSKSIGNIYSFLNESYILYSNSVSCINTYFKSVEIDIQKLEDIKEKYGITERETFNFFTPIKKYWHEDFHEIILLQILNPKTPEIGCISYLNRFSELLSEISKEYVSKIILAEWNEHEVVVENQYPVEEKNGDKRKGRIDILIHDDNKAIIIESKINNAGPRDDQLARYFDYIENTVGKTVVAVAYIRPVGDEKKMPSFEVSKRYTETIKRVEELLVPISVVNSQNQKDLCHYFLDTCCELGKNNKAKVFIQQYSDLLKNLGGKKMIKGIEKDIFKKLFEDADSIKKITAIGDVWENRYSILGALINESLKEMGFTSDGEQYTYKEITDTISLTFIYDPEWKEAKGHYIFGFSCEYATKEQKTDCETILKEKDFQHNLYEEVVSVDGGKGHIIAKYLPLECDRPPAEIIKSVMDLYKRLEELAINKLQ